MKADIFFFVTTLCVVFVSIAVIVFLVRLSNLTKTLTILANDLKEKAGSLGAEAEEMLESIKDSFIFRLFFGGSKKRTKKKK